LLQRPNERIQAKKPVLQAEVEGAAAESIIFKFNDWFVNIY
jgi:hypothetical protein